MAKRLTVGQLYVELDKLVQDGAQETVITVRALHEGTYKGVEGVGFDKATGRVYLYVSEGE